MNRLIVLLMLASAAAMLPDKQSTAAAFSWGVGMRDSKVVAVTDTTSSPTNLVVDSASFNATLIDAQGKTLGRRNIALPAGEIVPGKRQYWSFKQPYPTAQEVRADSLFTAWHASGEKADGEELGASEAIPGDVYVAPPAPLGEGRCEIYGRRAVEQNVRRKALSCNLTGPRWSSDVSYHSSWCKTRPEEDSERETMARDDLLRACARTKAISTVVPPQK